MQVLGMLRSVLLFVFSWQALVAGQRQQTVAAAEERLLLPGAANASSSDSRRLSTGSETTDGDVLCAFYNSVSAAKKTQMTNWKCAKDAAGNFVNGPCSTGALAWLAVSCTNGRVTRLDTNNANPRVTGLGGSLPSSLGSLDALTSLDLYSNSLVGSIPALSKLTNLQDLRLSDNSISGTIPSLSGLANLQDLYLFNNRLTGPITASACSLTTLVSFSVSGQSGSGFTCYPQCLSNNANSIPTKDGICTAAPTPAPTFFPCPAGKYASPSTNSTAGCQSCPRGSFSLGSTTECTACQAGKYSFDSTTECTACPRGSFSLGNTEQCTLCKSGYIADSAGLTACTACPLQFYSAVPGSSVCTKCGGGKVTPLPGATSEDQCLSPENNFVLGSVALCFAALGASFYVILGGLHKTAFFRRERVVMKQVAEFKKLFERLVKSEEAMSSTLRDERTSHTFQSGSAAGGNLSCKEVLQEVAKTLLFAVLAILVIALVTGVVFAVLLAQIFFQTLIIFKQSRNFLALPVDYRSLIAGVVEQLLEELRGLPPPLPVLFRFLFGVLLRLFDFLSLFRIDLSAVGVTCLGAGAPFQLLINLLVLGVVVVVVESEFQVFRRLCFSRALDRYLTRLVSREYRLYQLRAAPGSEQRTHGGTVWWYLLYLNRIISVSLTQGLFMLINLQSLMQFGMSLVQINTFAGGSNYLHAYSETCNQTPGAENFDTFLAYGSSFVAYALVLPVLYELSKILCPKDGFAAELKAARGDVELPQINADSGSVDAKTPSSLSLCAWARLPMTLVSPDVILSHITEGLSLMLSDSLDDGASKSESGRGSENAKGSAGSRLLLSVYSSLDRFGEAVVRTLEGQSEKETAAWLAQTSDRLPSYFELCQEELYDLTGRCGDLFAPPSRRRWPVVMTDVIGFALSVLLALVPVGHVLTTPGRLAFKHASIKYLRFVAASLGIWSDATYAAYDIEKKAEDICARDKTDAAVSKRSETNKIYSACLSSTIATRAILLQLVPPFTIWSVFVIATSGYPPFVPPTSKLFLKVSEPIIFHCFSDAAAIQREGKNHITSRGWITALSGISIFLLESRLLNFLVSSYLVFVSVYILYLPVTRALVLSAVFILMPIAFAVSLRLVVLLGQAMNVRDIWNLSPARSSRKPCAETEMAPRASVLEITFNPSLSRFSSDEQRARDSIPMGVAPIQRGGDDQRRLHPSIADSISHSGPEVLTISLCDSRSTIATRNHGGADSLRLEPSPSPSLPPPSLARLPLTRETRL